MKRFILLAVVAVMLAASVAWAGCRYILVCDPPGTCRYVWICD
jgi:hypothetical protein